MGQNFLLDQNITDKIINLSLQKQNKKDFSGANVFEVGPGPGGLTRAVLAAEPKSLTVVEMDERCIAIMNEIKEKTGDILHIINGDAMQTDFPFLLPLRAISSAICLITFPYRCWSAGLKTSMPMTA